MASPNHSGRNLFPALLCILLFLLSGCVAAPQYQRLKLATPLPGLPGAQELDWVPFNPQSKFQCGPAALATVLQANAIAVTADDLTDRVYIPDRRGSLQLEMQAAARSYGLVAHLIDGQLQALLQEISSGRPVLVLQNLGIDWLPRWHYAVVVGYDLEAERILLRSGTAERYSMPISVFELTWARGNHWGLVLLPPGELPVIADASSYFQAVSAFARQNPAPLSVPAWVAGRVRWPDNELLAMALGNSYYQNGQLRAAAATYSSILEINNRYAPAHNNLAQVLHELGENKIALLHAQEAVSAGGSHAATYRTTLATIENKMSGTVP